MSNAESLKIMKEFNHKLDIMIAYLACIGKDEETQDKILTNSGLTSNEIGKFFGTTGEAVRQRRTQKKKTKIKVK